MDELPFVYLSVDHRFKRTHFKVDEKQQMAMKVEL